MPIVGGRFQLVAKPVPGWRGIVHREILEVDQPHLVRYTWQGEEDGKATTVTYRIEPGVDGPRFTFEHTGFTGVGGFFVAALLGAVRRKMLNAGLPSVLMTSPKAQRMPLQVARADRSIRWVGTAGH